MYSKQFFYFFYKGCTFVALSTATNSQREKIDFEFF